MDVSLAIFTGADIDAATGLPYHRTQLNAIDYVILTVSCLGIVGNVVSLLVWRTHKTYNPVIFLFKYLAVVDIQHLVSTYCCRIIILFRRYFSDHTYFTVLFTAYGTELLGQSLSVHVTLLIAVCRFIVVSRPLEVYSGTLLTRCQVIVACVALSFWCLLITIPFPVITLLVFNDKLKVPYFLIVAILFLDTSIATLLIVIFNILLLKKLRYSSAVRPSTFSAQDSVSSGPGRGRRVTLVVVLMSVCTILAYLINGTTLALAFTYFHYTEKQSRSAYYIVFDVLIPIYDFLEALNSSINIIFYIAFFHNFRKVFPAARITEEITESSIQQKKLMNRNLWYDL
ncbi:FMRFamide receptor-like [Pomacea canaliculata]|uniref:FMRFamide receptor-like n=1 Tax=Pomacea canaliculata TaxID=400727 RepID=UPI000D735810|nr:FMRFamide receptor-like [Pomacea canaliculata]